MSDNMYISKKAYEKLEMFRRVYKLSSIDAVVNMLIDEKELKMLLMDDQLERSVGRFHRIYMKDKQAKVKRFLHRNE